MQAPRPGGPLQAAPKAEDFPALGGRRPASSSAAEASSNGHSAAAAGQAGVSEALKAANKVRPASPLIWQQCCHCSQPCSCHVLFTLAAGSSWLSTLFLSCPLKSGSSLVIVSNSIPVISPGCNNDMSTAFASDSTESSTADAVVTNASGHLRLYAVHL